MCLLAGGNWNNSSSCGSRARTGNETVSNVNANNGARNTEVRRLYPEVVIQAPGYTLALCRNNSGRI